MKHSLIILGVLACGTAAADTARIEISRSTIDLSSGAVSRNTTARTANPSSMDFGLSNWLPSGFSLPARIGGDTAFSGVGLPSLYWNYLTGVGLGDLQLKLGLNWAMLSRTAQLRASGTVTREDQNAYLLSGRVGIEYDPAALSSKFIAPYAGLSLLPTAAFSGPSSFDDGSLYGGVPVEFAIGARIPFRAIGISWQDASFEFGLDRTAGSIAHSSVAGFGLSGGARVSL